MIVFRNIFGIVSRRCSTAFHPTRRPGGWQLGRAKLELSRCAALDTAEPEGADRGRAQAAVGEALERRLVPAVATQAVKLQRVVALEQVGDRVQVNGGGHLRPRVRPMQAQGVSLVWRGGTRASDAAAQGW